MKFSREALAKAISAVIKELKDQSEAEYIQRVREYEAAAAAWMEQHGPSWVNACRAIQRKIKREEPVTEKDLPSFRLGYDRVAVFTHPMPVLRHETPKVLAELQTIVDALADDVVSSTALLDLGANKDALRRAVGHLEPGSVWR